MLDTERINEENNLNLTIEQIKKNIEVNSKLKIELTQKLKTASSSELNVLSNYKNIVEKSLENNINSQESPYFAKIDYFDSIENKNCILYIGKCGLEDEHEKNITIDWRAPIASVYYECQPGKNSIETYDGETLDVDLHLKRTFEIREGQLLDFYDVNTISNDDLLTKYLAKNKEAVLSDIVATIQKDQNEIIRESGSKNVIVQGGAGSGKTTVAMHRVSFLLYNYSTKFNTDNFYILGNNEAFLSYITGILPSLDVKDIKHKTLSDFFMSHIDDYVSFSNVNSDENNITISKAKNNYEYDSEMNDNTQVFVVKSRIEYIKELNRFLEAFEHENIPNKPIKLKGKVVMSRDNINALLNTFKFKSMQEKMTLLNDQFKKRLRNELELLSVKDIDGIVKKNETVFGDAKRKVNILAVYKQFLLKLLEESQENQDFFANEEDIELILGLLTHKKLDIFDLSCLAMIKRKLCTSKGFDDVKHIVIDEAQDFGVAIFYALKNSYDKATFTIVGDVTQNINYNMGMNDWEDLTKDIFNNDNDNFYVLTKSYRNTIEISNYAQNVLKKAKFKTYDIEPFLRHGNEVNVVKNSSDDEMLINTLKQIAKINEDGHNTIGIICKTEEEVKFVTKELSKHVDVFSFNTTEASFTKGIMVMSVKMSKGLEFDGVILWNVDEKNYTEEDSDIKLLYVAVTRALHELTIMYKDNLSKLLIDNK